MEPWDGRVRRRGAPGRGGPARKCLQQPPGALPFVVQHLAGTGPPPSIWAAPTHPADAPGCHLLLEACLPAASDSARCPPRPWQLPLRLAGLYPRDRGPYFLICFAHQTKLLGLETASHHTWKHGFWFGLPRGARGLHARHKRGARLTFIDRLDE